VRFDSVGRGSRNNRSDFLARYGHEGVHAGLIVIVPKTPLERQRELFRAVLQHIGGRDLTNTVVEVDFRDAAVECREYRFPPGGFGR
jgi:hypothetical protein